MDKPVIQLPPQETTREAKTSWGCNTANHDFSEDADSLSFGLKTQAASFTLNNCEQRFLLPHKF